MCMQQISFWMKTTPSEMDVEVIINIPSTMSIISQQQDKVTPHWCTPPKKRGKEQQFSSLLHSKNTGRETSQNRDHFSKFIATGGKCRAKWNYCPRIFAFDSVNGMITL